MWRGSGSLPCVSAIGRPPCYDLPRVDTSGTQSCYVKASSPIVRRPLGGVPERALKGLCGGAP
eukprot:5180643-Alexandrium_andersonii.AAC.1